MRITVEYFAQLRNAAGTHSESHELSPGGSLADLLDSIRTRHPDTLAPILGKAEQLPGWITVVTDGQVMRDMSISLNADATVRLLAPISGG
ncbi:MAG: MoaD/ThiS family protein [Phycisphaerales bacterium]|nr:MoaD/ThiS family protein [Phycisphaerales bacterium]